MIGRKVNHPKYGDGVVKRTRHKGFELQVEFESGLTLWIRQDKLKFIDEEATPPFKEDDWVNHPTFGLGRVISIEPYIYQDENTFLVEVDFKEAGPITLVQSIAKLEKVVEEEATAQVIKPLSDDPKFKSRRMVEAFRLGIVPYDCVEEFTFGRDKEIKQINEWLDDPNEGTMLIIGEYGTVRHIYFIMQLIVRYERILLLHGWKWTPTKLLFTNPNEFIAVSFRTLNIVQRKMGN